MHDCVQVHTHLSLPNSSPVQETLTNYSTVVVQYKCTSTDSYKSEVTRQHTPAHNGYASILSPTVVGHNLPTRVLK